MAVSKTQDFSTKDMPSLTGYVAIVTGGKTHTTAFDRQHLMWIFELGSDGIGFVTCRQLAQHGARVYILSRSPQKAAEAMASMKQSVPDKELDIHFLQVDLQSLESVNRAVEKFKAAESRLDLLINNAGVRYLPPMYLRVIPDIAKTDI